VNYGAVGIGGVQLPGRNPFTGEFTGSVTSPIERGYTSALSDVFRSSYPQWTFGVQIGYPIGASTAHANLERARLEYQQAQTQLKNMNMLIATQVREAARNVTTNQKRVQSARAARELQEKKLEAEEKKLAAGMSSSFFVFQAQRDLSQARTQEIQAISDYNKSLVDFEAVQLAPITGNAGNVNVAGQQSIFGQNLTGQGQGSGQQNR
jgi:hypothetical protein